MPTCKPSRLLQMLHRRSLVLERGGSNSSIQKPKTADLSTRPNAPLGKAAPSHQELQNGGVDLQGNSKASGAADANPDQSEQEVRTSW